MAKHRTIYPRPIQKFADLVGVSKWTLYKDEARGETSKRTAEKIGKALGVPWQSVFDPRAFAQFRFPHSSPRRKKAA